MRASDGVPPACPGAWPPCAAAQRRWPPASLGLHRDSKIVQATGWPPMARRLRKFPAQTAAVTRPASWPQPGPSPVSPDRVPPDTRVGADTCRPPSLPVAIGCSPFKPRGAVRQRERDNYLPRYLLSAPPPPPPLP